MVMKDVQVIGGCQAVLPPHNPPNASQNLRSPKGPRDMPVINCIDCVDCIATDGGEECRENLETVTHTHSRAAAEKGMILKGLRVGKGRGIPTQIFLIS